MPRGIPKKTNDGQISKMEAMRRAIGEIGRDCKPADYQVFIKSKFGLEMSADMISNYKSTLLKDGATKSTVQTPQAQAKPAGGFKLDELAAVKALSDKIGAEKVLQLAQVLAK
jgi:hypothetical protein